ncbi:DUF3298 domain-containing protein [Dysosmobacter sp.]|uniref:DUF3298 domain-containing protein n=1 Tax=Dysosmobacter sp. TaxID=2591382 RepID=UPI003AB2833D
MKKNGYQMLVLLTLLCSMLLLSACTAEAAVGEEAAAPAAEEQTEPTLESLLGEDYVDYLTETITMQMGNRMDKDPEVRYFPIEDNAPLSDYVTIDENTEFEVDDEGNPVIIFPAGTVTDEANSVQSFRVPKLYQ